jgi:uncharacterized protein (DUF488 family)
MEHAGTLWTIGHSTRPLEIFIAMLQDEGIEALVDVRRFAGSRRNPQYASEALARSLPASGMVYVPMPDLGGRRKAREDTHHTAWRNASFRGYADYMDTAPYAAARSRLATLASERRTAVMCAEAMWWQCHRSLISDDFKASGWTVLHILAPARVDEHPYTSAAHVEDGRLSYAAPPDAQGALF